MEFWYNFAKNGDEQKMALSVCRTVIDDFARELLKHGTAAFPIACYHDDLQTEPVPWHWHEELEVLVVSEGTILATAAGEKYRLEKESRAPFQTETSPQGADGGVNRGAFGGWFYVL